MAINYTTYTNQIANLMAALSSDPNFITFLPGAIDYAEQRIYRELDLNATFVYDGTTALSSGNRNFVLPTDVGTYITVDEVLITVPSSLTNGVNTVQLIPVSHEFLTISFPSILSSNCGQPEYFSVRTGLGGGTISPALISVGPTPDLPYPVTIGGIQRPTPLSASNSSTILTQYVPDLFVAATMVFAAGYMRDFGAQTDNPQMSQSWETQYQALKQSAIVESLRSWSRSEGWTTKQPSPIATPKRV